MVESEVFDLLKTFTFTLALPVGFVCDSKRAWTEEDAIYASDVDSDLKIKILFAQTRSFTRNQRYFLLCPFGWPQDIVECSTRDNYSIGIGIIILTSDYSFTRVHLNYT